MPTEQDATYRAFFRNAPTGMYRSARDGRLTDVNLALVSLLGYASEDELLAVNLRDVYADPSERDRLIRQHAGREWFEGIETTWRRRDGTLVPVRLSGHILQRDRGAMFEGLVVDLRAQRQWEEYLRTTDRLQAMGQLASGIAHDFNNLLTVVIGHADLLAEALPPATAILENVQEIQRAAVSAAGLTRQLLAFARQQPRQPTVLDLGTQLRETGRMLGTLVGDEVELELPPVARSAWIEMDRSQLDQVLLNLASNARDAMPTGGRLTFSVEEVTLQVGAFGPHVQVTPGRFVLLTVADTGLGMDAQTKARVFEPFFTTKGPDRGNGLGLATIYGIVKQGRGFIFVDSEPGRGARFRLYWPSAAPIGPEHEAETEVPEVSEVPLVLVVEDEPGVRALISAALRRSGYQVLEVRHAEEGLAMAEEVWHQLALLVSDIGLPGMSGVELARRAQESRPNLKVLLLSGDPYSGGAVGLPVLAKPFSRARLLQAVDGLINERAI